MSETKTAETTEEIEKVICSCGSELSKKNINAHEKTDLHLKKLKRISDAKSVGQLKIRERFDKIDSQLDIINLKLSEVLDLLYEEDDLTNDPFDKNDDKKDDDESEVSDDDLPEADKENSSSDDESSDEKEKDKIKITSKKNKKPVNKKPSNKNNKKPIKGKKKP